MNTDRERNRAGGTARLCAAGGSESASTGTEISRLSEWEVQLAQVQLEVQRALANDNTSTDAQVKALSCCVACGSVPQ
jgi:hypothetical protein